MTAASFAFLSRHRLAGQHRFIDVALALGDLAVDRHGLARPHAQQIARRRPGRAAHPSSRLARKSMRGLRREVEQRADRIAGRIARPQLQHLADKHQRDDHRRRLEIDRRPHLAAHREQLRRQQRDDREQIGRRDAEPDQRPHVRRAVAQRTPEALGRTAVPPTARPASPAPARSSRRAVAPHQSRNRRPTSSPIDRTRIGTLSTAETINRRVKSTSSGFGPSSSDATTGSSAMPQIGQAPGPSCTICGCIGQVYLRCRSPLRAPAA